MKRTFKCLIFCSIVIGVHTSYAQAEAGNGKWTDNSNKTGKAEVYEESDFTKTTIELHNRKITFSNLPQISKSAVVTITNKDGELIQQAKINPVEHTMDIRYLEKGTYFVNLKYKSEQKKGFVLNL